MATNTGTYDITSLQTVTDVSAAEFGLDTIADVLQADLDAWNQSVSDMVSEMAEITADRQRAYGTSIAGEMQEVDEYGLASTQKAEAGDTVGFPLRLMQYNIGWTAKYLQVATPAKLAIQQIAAEDAHWRRIQKEIKKAIYGSANYSFRDHLIDNVVLAVKRFVNADSAGIPNGPNGETFDGATETHYLANNGWLASALLAAINDVVEHGHGGDVVVAINQADETAVRALSGFVPYIDPRIAMQTIATTGGVPNVTVDITSMNNRRIGIFGSAEVWVKPWVLDNYPVIWDRLDPNKPLAFRQREQATLQGLRLAAENDDYPLYVKDYEAEFGVGVWTRTNGAVLYVGGGSYVNPTI
jgi:hypothetical protein